MTLLLNLLWVVFGGGLVIFIEYALAGLLLCLTVVGAPFGLQCFKIAGLGLFPFGKDIQDVRRGIGSEAAGSLLNIVWFLVAGLWIFLSHLALALGLAVTLIGIPFAFQHLKLAMLALAPFGQRVR
ncbi:MAG TPA: YccF domain-containing protein [Myxococcaceae bacterium]|nr:YccF domain-containing protein [Myxococcaceae bacterium]